MGCASSPTFVRHILGCASSPTFVRHILGYASSPTFVRLSFAYPSLSVRCRWLQKKWHKNCDTISKMFGLTL
ncbi:hypothetical protein HMPREF9074_07268 [Capnocytophaga sp. oral taxon 329 str. F0087]|nr:hypothetical protein HMPREF9074_07268 [Capnocytophaga sp. oral taxon 329 str. F0087]